MSAETHAFQTEVSQLLDLMIHSLYTNRDVFLRELVSNASDAIDRRRFAGLTDAALLPEETPRIVLRVDAEAQTLSIEDDGLGMSRDEVIENLGTIARSGTGEFLKAAREAQSSEVAPDLIGQFGVGFYASFMVAERVRVVTRRAGEDSATSWVSSGDGSFETDVVDRGRVGTTVTLHLRPVDDEDGLRDYTDEYVLRQIVKKYSDFVAHPIHLELSGSAPAGGTNPLNSMKAIWTRPDSDLEEGELQEFYKHISHDWTEPLLHLHSRIEGTFEAQALLFVPSVAPFDLYHREMAHRGIQLYVKRVFIMDECRELMPEYLRFVKGVVDAEGLSLNVSREMLQQDRQIRVIRNHLVKKVVDALAELMKNDREKYERFFAQFGPVLKEGLLAFDEKRERILDLVLVQSTHGEGVSSLAEVVARMAEGQKEIFFMTGPSRQVLENSPHLEAFRDKGIEVLLLTDPVDEVWLQQAPPAYKEKIWRSAGQGEVAREERADQNASYRDLLTCMRAALQDDVQEVRLSNRLTSSPACLVLAEGDVTPAIEQMLRQAGQEVPTVKPILELNPAHALMVKLRQLFESEPTDARIPEYATLLYDHARVSEGGLPKDPAGFGRRLSELMVRAL
jgi:molecular chaperone HtpG